jgi:hypothetical protein
METKFTKTEERFTNIMFKLISMAIGIKCVIRVILGRPRSISSNYSNSYNIFQKFKYYKFTLRFFKLRKNVDQIIRRVL